ncbi:MAG TPA: threonine--tRNA ligase [Thermodesulfobacteriota bacterium]|nr:threonine--tRNA ligase [Thermodesulfobacteriota bacterium]
MGKAILPEGREFEFTEGSTFLEVLKDYDKKLAKKTVAVKADGEFRDLVSPIASGDGPVHVEPVTMDSPEGLDIMRHSTSHVMAQAVKSLYKNVKLAIGPVIEGGFYYDFETERPFTPEDLEKIESRMREIIKGNHPFEGERLPKEKALTLFKGLGESYKEELINDIEDASVGVYRQSDFVDLCRGPHIPSTGYIKAFKLTGTAGAYWRGDERNRMLQRIYGTAFPSKEALTEHLRRLEEAKRRDHRKLGRELDLFSTSEHIGAGLVLWHPKGARIRGIIEDFWRAEHWRNGYEIIYTPHIATLDLWKTSGHWDFYRENLYSPMEVEGQDYIVKPMNCPFHIQIYKSRLRSYRDLPVRYAELGTVYRFERSGVLHGLLRVRGFTQDDAHIFMTPDQLEEEIKGVLKFTLYILRSFGFNEFDVYLSTRPEKYVGELDKWQRAEAALKGALEALSIVYEIDPGEGVFYGPKIDIKIKDVLGRSWQCSTIQVDFNLPERFDVTYRDEKGQSARPIMIHRALMGSLERFFGCLIEHYAGAFPLWLAPVQTVILTVTDRGNEYAKGVYEKLKGAGLRVELDIRNEKLGFKIREAELEKIPYLLVVGDKEEAEGLVAPRAKGRGALPSVTIEEFVEMILKENRPQGGEPL